MVANLLALLKELLNINMLLENTKLLFTFISSARSAIILFISFSILLEITKNIIKSS